MYRHGPACLEGPVSAARPWWSGAGERDAEPVPVEDVRWELVDRVRRELADGTYDTEDKLEIALTRLAGRHDLA